MTFVNSLYLLVYLYLVQQLDIQLLDHILVPTMDPYFTKMSPAMTHTVAVEYLPLILFATQVELLELFV